MLHDRLTNQQQQQQQQLVEEEEDKTQESMHRDTRTEEPEMTGVTGIVTKSLRKNFWKPCQENIQ